MAIEATVAAPSTTTGVTPAVLTVSGILTDLNNGLDRAAIQTKYGLTTAEVSEIFKHPKLKGQRAKRKILRFSLVDDTDGNTVAAAQYVVPTTPAQETPVVNPNQMTIMDVPGVDEQDADVEILAGSMATSNEA
jgi:hypothetical protein